MKRMNFGGNVPLNPRLHFTPKTEAEVLEILNQHQGRSIRCIGRLHSWSQVIDSPDVQLDLRHFDQVEPRDDATKSVEVGAGCQIKRLLEELERKTAWTLPSVGFITEQSIAGAISTGTHGSGRHSLSHYVIGLRVARYDRQTGDAVVVNITAGEELRAARCSLGCMGVILSVTMECRPKYFVEERFLEYKHLEDVLAAEEEYPLQQFYLIPWRWSYFVQHRRESEAKASRARWLYGWYRFLILDLAMHWVILFVVHILSFRFTVKAVFRWIAPAFVIRNWPVVGPSSKQLVMEHELFRHVEIELFVQRRQLSRALLFLKNALEVFSDKSKSTEHGLIEQLSEAKANQRIEELRGSYCHHYPICIRRVLADDTMISMASNAHPAVKIENESGGALSGNEDWYSITLTNYHRGKNRQRFSEVASFLAQSMSILYGARPHWGKLCPVPARELRSLYPAFEEFQAICNRVDDQAVFRNPWTAELLENPSQQFDKINK